MRGVRNRLATPLFFAAALFQHRFCRVRYVLCSTTAALCCLLLCARLTDAVPPDVQTSHLVHTASITAQTVTESYTLLQGEEQCNSVAAHGKDLGCTEALRVGKEVVRVLVGVRALSTRGHAPYQNSSIPTNTVFFNIGRSLTRQAWRAALGRWCE